MTRILLFVCVFFSSYACAICTVTDDAGKTLTLKQPAKRIVSLAPDITETLFAIGAGKHVIAVMSGSNFPPAAKQLPVIGSYTGVDLEHLIALQPDLIVVWKGTFPRQMQALKQWHIPIYTSQPRRLEDVARTMKNLGCLTGTEKTANQAADQFSHALVALRQRYHTQQPVSVFYQIGSYSLITINKESWINQVITLCGGVNVFANALTIAPEISWESVVSANPQVIISDAARADWKTRWQAWPMLTAVRRQHLFAVNPDWIDRAGPRLLQGTAQVCEFLRIARQTTA